MNIFNKKYKYEYFRNAENNNFIIKQTICNF